MRQGFRFLDDGLPRMLATLPDALSPRIVRGTKGLAEDGRQLDQRNNHLSEGRDFAV